MKSFRTLLVILVFALAMRSVYSTLVKSFVPHTVFNENEILFRFIGKIIFYFILIITSLFLYKMRKPEVAQMLVRQPQPLRVLIASLFGVILLAFAYGEDGLETMLLAQVDIELAYSFWEYPPDFIVHEYNYVDWLMLCLGSVIIAPFAEELFFRGILLTELNRRFDRNMAAFYSSCLFTLLHYSNLHVISTMIFSIALCRIYIATSSLWLCTIVHSVFNLGALLVENFAVNNIVLSYEELPILSSWTFMLILFLVSSCALACAQYWSKK